MRARRLSRWIGRAAVAAALSAGAALGVTAIASADDAQQADGSDSITSGQVTPSTSTWE